ncbi:hypothetical protein QWZ02_06420 [Kinneretia asaccharophila]|uniref:Ig-like protein group 1 n=1 Tax=Roseateles asaccharophilus TaxID=582607 RepID=A0A4R6N2L3_9BURK|nr:hypothetical protein [Roseateles asaccharophilus]MDN3544078.1 hypothetical protein [Roseateles asaccharophilus]TDP09327.1 hypothetical protein DFR39_105165 [Roseateles asaccharophilus]
MSGFWNTKLAAARAGAALALVALLSACGGGGGDAGTPVVGPETGAGVAVAALAVATNVATLPNDGTATATITVTALDAKNAAIKGATVSLSIAPDSSGVPGTISPGSGVTDEKGELKATLGIGDNKTKRAITVTATSGGISKTATVTVVDSTTAPPVAADASVSLSKTSVQNTGTDFVEVTVAALDEARNTIANMPVKFRMEDPSNTAFVETPPTVTDAKGQAKATVKIGNDRNNRVIAVVAEVGALTRKASFSVTGAKLSASPRQNTLTVGQPGSIEYSLVDAAGSAINDATITVSGPAGASGSGKTVDGKYVYSYTAAGAGPTVIKATAAGGVSVDSVIQIGAAVSDVPAGTTIDSATFTASPVVVRVNQVGSTANRAELRLLFRTANNQPIPNVRVRLGLGSNASGTDGTISTTTPANDVIIADAQGVATSSFIPGQLSSPTGGVKIFACFGKTDAVEQIAACPADRLREVALTVVQEAVSVSIGTNGTLIVNPNTYAQDFVALVVDAAGNPQRDVQLAAVIDLPTYQKGFWTRPGNKWIPTFTAQCANEDNSLGGYRNNTIEAGEDANGNAQLDPRKSDVTVTFVGSSKTDANGQAVLRIEYAQSTGSWVEYSLRVSATTVVSPPAWWGRQVISGALSGAAQYLEVPASAVSSEAKPPFQQSPYGQIASCSNPN